MATVPARTEDVKEPVLCDQCGTQIGWQENNQVILFSRHHGEKHQTKIIRREMSLEGLTTEKK